MTPLPTSISNEESRFDSNLQHSFASCDGSSAAITAAHTAFTIAFCVVTPSIASYFAIPTSKRAPSDLVDGRTTTATIAASPYGSFAAFANTTISTAPTILYFFLCVAHDCCYRPFCFSVCVAEIITSLSFSTLRAMAVGYLSPLVSLE